MGESMHGEELQHEMPPRYEEVFGPDAEPEFHVYQVNPVQHRTEIHGSIASAQSELPTRAAPNLIDVTADGGSVAAVHSEHNTGDASSYNHGSAGNNGESPQVHAIRLFGNPLAQDSHWSVRRQDYSLFELPDVDPMVRLKLRIKNGSPMARSEPLPCFVRVPSSNPHFVANETFLPMVLSSSPIRSSHQGLAFASTYDGETMARHDVSAADWYQFLEDIAVVSKTEMQPDPPLPRIMGWAGLISARMKESRIKAGEEDPLIAELLNGWREKFFLPRGVDVTLKREMDDSSSDAGESSDSELENPTSVPFKEGRQWRREARRRRRELRRERRQLRREQRREHRRERKLVRRGLLPEVYRLVVKPLVRA